MLNLSVEFPQHNRFLSNLSKIKPKMLIDYFNQFHEFIEEEPNFL